MWTGGSVVNRSREELEPALATLNLLLSILEAEEDRRRDNPDEELDPCNKA